MAYNLVTVDLTAIVDVNSKQRLTREGKPIAAVSVTRMPAGATLRLHLGQQDGIFVDGTVSIVGLVSDEDSTRGLFYSNAVAQPGVLVELIVSYAPPGSASALASV